MKFLNLITFLFLSNPDLSEAKTVREVLIYFLSGLLICFGFVIRYLVKLNNDRFEDKDNLILSHEKKIISLELIIKENNDYIIKQSESLTGVLIDNSNVLKSVVKTSDKLNEEVVSKVKVAVLDTNKIINEIENDIKNRINNYGS